MNDLMSLTYNLRWSHVSISGVQVVYRSPWAWQQAAMGSAIQGGLLGQSQSRQPAFRSDHVQDPPAISASQFSQAATVSQAEGQGHLTHSARLASAAPSHGMSQAQFSQAGQPEGGGKANNGPLSSPGSMQAAVNQAGASMLQGSQQGLVPSWKLASTRLASGSRHAASSRQH